MRSAMLSGALVLALTTPAKAAAPALTSKEEVLWASLKTRLDGVASRLDGVLGYSVKDLKTGATIELRPQETFPTASAIKLGVLYELYAQADEGRIDLSELTRPGLPRVGGAGVLAFFGDKATLTWHDLAALMFTLSDNDATNVLIDKVGLEPVNARLEALGLRSTRLRRRMMDLAAASRGLENVGTPSEMRQLAEHVYAGTRLSKERAADMRAVAMLPKDSPFRKGLPDTLRILDKSGELEAVRSVAAVVDLPGRPYAVSVLTTYLRHDDDGDAAIREISATLFETFDRFSRSSDLGRIISAR